MRLDEVILKGYRPGVIGRLAELHATYYYENWGFGLFFEAKVATELSEFLSRYEESRDGFWTLSLKHQIRNVKGVRSQQSTKGCQELRPDPLSFHLAGNPIFNQG